MNFLMSPIGSIRNWTYDTIVSRTPSFYRFVLLNHIRPNSRILEVGIGNGSCIVPNSDLIIEKNLTIVGIDIDVDYLDRCRSRIAESGTESRVSVVNQDLLTFEDESRFDYILFSESFPVIEEPTMCRMMDRCRSLVRTVLQGGPPGQVLFVHNLETTHSPFRAFVKPLLRYFPGIWVDFGRLVTHTDFDEFVQKTNYRIVKKERIECVSVLKNIVEPVLQTRLGVRSPSLLENVDFTMDQYVIVTIPC